MLQHINLYPKDTVNKKSGLNSISILLYSGCLILIMVCGIVYSYIDYKSLKAFSIKTEANYEKMMAQYKRANKQLVDKMGGREVGEAVSILALKLERNQSLLNVLKGGGESGLSFLSVINAVNESDVEGLEIDSMAIVKGGNGVVIEGRSLNSDAVSQYLKYLTTQSYFKTSVIDKVSYRRGDGEDNQYFKLISHKYDGAYVGENIRSVAEAKKRVDRYFRN